MSANETGYTIKTQVHINDINPTTGQISPGWEITVYDKVTGVVVPVFVPDSVYGADQARTLIEHALTQVRSVHALSN